MINNRNVNIITDSDGNKIVYINDIKFKGKQNIDWDEVQSYLKGYVGDSYSISENIEKVFIGNDFVKEFPKSESRTALAGARAKAKANAATAIPELIRIATNSNWEENQKEKHNKRAKYGWYRYDIRFALPVYENEIPAGYNIFKGQLLINRAENGKNYLYDILGIKKETRSPQQ